jgi:hypothetical protein
MRSSRPWAVSGRCWVEHVGIFSFLTGKKDDEAATAAMKSDTSAAATIPAEAVGASGPEEHPADTSFHPPRSGILTRRGAEAPQPAEV